MKKEPLQVTGIIIPIIVALFNILILLFPSEMIQAASTGISLWFNNVFPSLLPFIIGTNILSGLGFISFIGTLLEPIMYPLFGVPGCGGFAVITGMTSGYPMGAKVTAGLRESNELNQVEAQRLISFTNNSGPLFMLGAVGIGMLSSPKAGYFIMIVSYIAAIITGLIFKYYKYNQHIPKLNKTKIFTRAFQNMKTTRLKDKRNLGEILSDSVKNAMETIVQVGGFIIIFCVIVKVFEITNFVAYSEFLFKDALDYFGISSNMYKGIFMGIIEVTNGAKVLAEESFSKNQLILTTGIVSFGGLCIHAQTLSFINKTDIKASVYILSKVLQGIIAVATAQLLYPYFDFFTNEHAPVSLIYGNRLVDRLAFSTLSFVLSIMMLILFIVFYNMLGVFGRK